MYLNFFCYCFAIFFKLSHEIFGNICFIYKKTTDMLVIRNSIIFYKTFNNMF